MCVCANRIQRRTKHLPVLNHAFTYQVLCDHIAMPMVLTHSRTHTRTHARTHACTLLHHLVASSKAHPQGSVQAGGDFDDGGTCVSCGLAVVAWMNFRKPNHRVQRRMESRESYLPVRPVLDRFLCPLMIAIVFCIQELSLIHI